MDMSLDIYVDYLICSTSYTTATGLARLTNNQISHDKVTRFLSSRDYTSADLWMVAKSLCKNIEDPEAALVIDDSIEEKSYTDENELICWHFDHSKNRSVKGINFLTSFYESQHGQTPVGYALVRKTEMKVNRKTNKEQRKSPISKNEHYRDLIKRALENGIRFKYVLNDSWYSSVENMKYINLLGKEFIMAVKRNRRVALSEKDKANGNFVRIDSLELGEGTLVWLQGLDFSLHLVRQVFKNEDGSTGVLYLVSSVLELTNEQIATIYKRRWKVETYHKSIKNNASLAKSPTKTPRTQANHFFASLCAYIRLEVLSKSAKLNHFSLKQFLYINALKSAMFLLQSSFHPSPFSLSENLPKGFA